MLNTALLMVATVVVLQDGGLQPITTRRVEETLQDRGGQFDPAAARPRIAQNPAPEGRMVPIQAGGGNQLDFNGGGVQPAVRAQLGDDTLRLPPPPNQGGGQNPIPANHAPAAGQFAADQNRAGQNPPPDPNANLAPVDRNFGLPPADPHAFAQPVRTRVELNEPDNVSPIPQPPDGQLLQPIPGDPAAANTLPLPARFEQPKSGFPAAAQQDNSAGATPIGAKPTANKPKPKSKRKAPTASTSAAPIATPRPWFPLMMTSLALFASIGVNVYLGWIALGAYQRYQSLARDVAHEG